VTVTSPNPDRLKLTINPRLGTFTGSFLGAASARNPISGVLYQKTNVGAGLFIGASQTGSALLTPQ
jgi:hypothetical protein